MAGDVAEVALSFVRGEDGVWNLFVQKSKTDASPENIAGWTFDVKVKRKDADLDPTLVTAAITPNVSTSIVNIVWASAALATLLGDYRVSAWRINVGGNTCLARGSFSIIDSTQF